MLLLLNVPFELLIWQRQATPWLIIRPLAMFLVIPQRKVYGVWSIRRGTGSTCRKQCRRLVKMWKLKIETNQLPNSYLRIPMLPWHPSSVLLASGGIFIARHLWGRAKQLGLPFLRLFTPVPTLGRRWDETWKTRYAISTIQCDAENIFCTDMQNAGGVFLTSWILPLWLEQRRTPMQKREQRVRTSVFLPRPSCSVLSWTHRQL